jgi:hypothetical protein
MITNEESLPRSHQQPTKAEGSSEEDTEESEGIITIKHKADNF